MNVKTGTQTWSKSEQRTDFDREKVSNISASEKSQLFGDESIGDTLNKIADPNWIDPTKKMRSVGNSELNKDAFLNLLLAQMKNQDPTNPLKSHEMAAQLAQFTSLEKLTNINSAIEELTKVQKPGQNFGALSLIGKAVAGDSSQIVRTAENETHDIRFRLSADAVSGTLTIKDETGAVVRTLKLSKMKSGDNEINWNGMNEEGRTLGEGRFSASIEAISSNGAKLAAETKFAGVISGVNFTPSGPVLMIGKQAIPMSDIKEIVDPATIKAAAPQPLKALTQELPPQAKGAQPAPATQVAPAKVASNLDSVAMSRGLDNNLKKSGVKTNTL